jgi:tRNA A37 threonylcarbamoyladenosine dehydratase
MLHRFSRTELLIGPAGLAKLADTRVAVFGIGGVGSYTVEALARSGIGHLVLVDYDDICLTNINRQIHALQNTVGQSKVELMKERVMLINPQAKVEAIPEFYTPEKSSELIRVDFDYIVDAIDNVTGKLDLIKNSYRQGIPIVSAMGAGNKLDPTAFEVEDISKTSVDPLARVIRRELKKAGISQGIKVVYSKEQPMIPLESVGDCKLDCICSNKDAISNCAMRRQIPGSIAFVPPVMGMILAGVVVRDLLNI